jgi:hypothetical protein
MRSEAQQQIQQTPANANQEQIKSKSRARQNAPEWVL